SAVRDDRKSTGEVAGWEQRRSTALRSSYAHGSRQQGPSKCQRGPSIGKPGSNDWEIKN
ncbi:hypothetical protein TcasGA2_TC032279, partial [Tribolium castaneum]